MNSTKLATCLQAALDSEAVSISTWPTLSAMPLSLLDLHRAIRLPEVLRIMGLSRSAWYALLNPKLSTYDSKAPRPFKLGNSDRSASAWWAWEVLAYLQSKSDACRVH